MNTIYYKSLAFWKKGHKKHHHPLNPKVLEFMCNIFKYIYFVRCTECRALIKAQKYSRQFYRILTIGSQNFEQIE